MAIRNLQASVSAANRLNLTGIAGEAVGSLTADDGYYVLGLDTFNVANTNPEYDHITELCMCNKNIYTIIKMNPYFFYTIWKCLNIFITHI